MALTELQESLLNELTNYVDNWRKNNGIDGSDALEGDALVKFVLDIQQEIMDNVSMDGKSGQTLILYTGTSVETGNKLYVDIDEYCKINSEYYYISSTDGGSILWLDDFKEAIIDAIGDKDVANKILSGCEYNEESGLYNKRVNQYAIEGTEILSMDDFISKTLTENAVKNGNNIIYVLGEGWNSDSVGIKTEIPTFIENAWIGQDIDSAMKSKFTIVNDWTEITDDYARYMSDVDMFKTEFYVDENGKVTGVKLVSEIGDIDVGNISPDGMTIAYGSKLGILTDSELISKNSFLSECTQTDLNAYRAYEYLKLIGADDSTIRKTGLLPDTDLKSMHTFLSDCTEADLNAYRNYEYLKSVGASDDVLRATGLLPDSDLKFKYDFLSDCTDLDILGKFRNYEYISSNNIAKTTADVMSEMNIYVDTNGKLISIVEASATDIPTDYACKVTLGDASHFLLDDVMESTYSFYKDLSAPEKIKFKEYDYLTRYTTMHLDKISISDATMNKYLSAAGKTADQLNAGDMCFMKMADALASGDADTVKWINKLSDSCKGISKVANTAMPIVDAVGTFAIAGVSIYNAVTLYNAGYENEASAIMTGCAVDVIGGIAGGAAITGAISPYLVGAGAVLGGPAGAAIGAVVAGVIGYGAAGIASSQAGTFIRENWDAILMTVEDVYGAVDEGVHDLYGLVLAGFDADADGAYFKGDKKDNFISAGNGNNKVEGFAGNDSLYGGGGDDTMYGGEGNDTVCGDSGRDTLYGDAGNDTLIGGTGSDTMYGGEGNDTYVWGVGYGTDTIRDGAGVNKIIFDGVNPEDLRVQYSDIGALLINKNTDEILAIPDFMSFYKYILRLRYIYKGI